MTKGRFCFWCRMVGVLSAFLFCFGFAASVVAESSHTVIPTPSKSNHQDARAVAYSSNAKLLPENGANHISDQEQLQTSSHLPDLRLIKDVHKKKEVFFSFMLPLVQQENEYLRTVRQRLLFIKDHVRWGRTIADEDHSWLTLVSNKFDVDSINVSDHVFWRELLMRVDEVPENLVLVQAANESAWGTSRFAREGNNLFGQWCFSPNCGLVPQNRPPGATYMVAEFSSISESVCSYMHNLNTGKAYVLLRDVRGRMRGENQEPDASEMAMGLISYSERGQVYVEEIRSMIRHNQAVIAEVKLRIDG